MDTMKITATKVEITGRNKDDLPGYKNDHKHYKKSDGGFNQKMDQEDLKTYTATFLIRGENSHHYPHHGYHPYLHHNHNTSSHHHHHHHLDYKSPHLTHLPQHQEMKNVYECLREMCIVRSVSDEVFVRSSENEGDFFIKKWLLLLWL
nr:hypothetical protein [Tanacetum cinerariifolium]